MSPHSLDSFLRKNSTLRDGRAYNKTTGKRFAACCPMHTFGTPCRFGRSLKFDQFGCGEDAAESLGSYLSERHVGTFGKLAAVSFNETVTTGGGDSTDDEKLASRARHLTTTAKVAHPYQLFTTKSAMLSPASLNACGKHRWKSLKKSYLSKHRFNLFMPNFFMTKNGNYFPRPRKGVELLAQRITDGFF